MGSTAEQEFGGRLAAVILTRWPDNADSIPE